MVLHRNRHGAMDKLEGPNISALNYNPKTSTAEKTDYSPNNAKET